MVGKSFKTPQKYININLFGDIWLNVFLMLDLFLMFIGIFYLKYKFFFIDRLIVMLEVDHLIAHTCVTKAWPVKRDSVTLYNMCHCVSFPDSLRLTSHLYLRLCSHLSAAAMMQLSPEQAQRLESSWSMPRLWPISWASVAPTAMDRSLWSWERHDRPGYMSGSLQIQIVLKVQCVTSPVAE